MFHFPGNEKAEETEEKLRSETDVTCGKLVKDLMVSFLKAFLRLVCMQCSLKVTTQRAHDVKMTSQ